MWIFPIASLSFGYWPAQDTNICFCCENDRIALFAGRANHLRGKHSPRPLAMNQYSFWDHLACYLAYLNRCILPVSIGLSAECIKFNLNIEMNRNRCQSLPDWVSGIRTVAMYCNRTHSSQCSFPKCLNQSDTRGPVRQGWWNCIPWNFLVAWELVPCMLQWNASGSHNKMQKQMNGAQLTCQKFIDPFCEVSHFGGIFRIEPNQRSLCEIFRNRSKS